MVKAPESCCGHLSGTVQAGRNLHHRRKGGVVLNPDGIASGLFGVIYIKKGVGIENVIGIPYHGLPPVDPLPANTDVGFAGLNVERQPVKGGVQEKGVLFEQVPRQVHPPRIPGRQDRITGICPDHVARKQPVPDTGGQPDLVADGEFQVEPVVQEVFVDKFLFG